MFKKFLTTGAVAAASLLMVVGGSSAAMAADGENLIVNGGFDAPGFSDNNGQFFDGDNVGGWEIGMNSGGDPNTKTLQVWYPEMDGAGPGYAAPFPDGPWARVMGTIEQTIPTEAGKTYVLEYLSRASGSDANQWAAGWRGGNGSHVLVDGVAVDFFVTVTDPLSTIRTVTFTATSDETVISFKNNDNGGAVGFDNVSVTKVPENDSPLMVPAIAGGIGMAALAAGSGLVISRKNKRAGK